MQLLTVPHQRFLRRPARCSPALHEVRAALGQVKNRVWREEQNEEKGWRGSIPFIMFTVQALEPQRQQPTAARPRPDHLRSSPLRPAWCLCVYVVVLVCVCVNGKSTHLKDPSATLSRQPPSWSQYGAPLAIWCKCTHFPFT